MKAKSLLLSAISTLGISSVLMAQSISCSDFNVIGFSPDSLDASKYNFSVEFSASDTVFINYPYISTVLDCNGDTVATGSFNFFGQSGQTTFEYPVTLTGSLSCEPLSVIFVYSNDIFENDTCSLSFNVADLNSDFEEQKVFSLYPNPVVNSLTINSDHHSPDSVYKVFDHTGRIVLEGTIDAATIDVDMRSQPAGVYFIHIFDDFTHTFKFIKQ